MGGRVKGKLRQKRVERSWGVWYQRCAFRAKRSGGNFSLAAASWTTEALFCKIGWRLKLRLKAACRAPRSPPQWTPPGERMLHPLAETVGVRRPRREAPVDARWM